MSHVYWKDLLEKHPSDHLFHLIDPFVPHRFRYDLLSRAQIGRLKNIAEEKYLEANPNDKSPIAMRMRSRLKKRLKKQSARSKAYRKSSDYILKGILEDEEALKKQKTKNVSHKKRSANAEPKRYDNFSDDESIPSHFG